MLMFFSERASKMKRDLKAHQTRRRYFFVEKNLPIILCSLSGREKRSAGHTGCCHLLASGTSHHTDNDNTHFHSSRDYLQHILYKSIASILIKCREEDNNNNTNGGVCAAPARVTSDIWHWPSMCQLKLGNSNTSLWYYIQMQRNIKS